MLRPPQLARYTRDVCALVVAAAFIGACGSVPGVTSANNAAENGEQTDTSLAQVYESPGGTSDLGIGIGGSGAATLKRFDPGAFVRAAPATETVDDDLLSPAQFDGGDDPPPPPSDPPPPPPGDSPPPPDGSAPPPPDGSAPPPPDGDSPPPPDGDSPPPPDGEFPPPPDGEFPPPPDGEYPPPPDGEYPPPPDGEYPPPPDGEYPPSPDGEFPPPPDGEFPPPPDGEFPPPPDGEFPPPPDGFFFPPPESFDGSLPPPPEGFEPGDGFFPPPEGFDADGPFSVPPPPDGFQGEGGFFAPPEGFNSEGILFVPPEGFEGDAIYLPPPPEHFDGDGFFFPPPPGYEGEDGFIAPPDFFEVYNGFPPPPPEFDGEWQPPPPQEWNGSSDWAPPPPDQLYADGEWFPPPPPMGWEGEWFPPPPPPAGLEEFPGEFFFSNKFDEFFVEEGLEDGPPPFEAFPFDAFLEQHSLHDIIPGVPPEFEHGAFGEFGFGEVPPPPPGFPLFPPPPDFTGAAFGDFGSAFGPPPNGPPPPGGFPEEISPGAPPDLPAEFFHFQEKLGDLHTFLEDFEFLPPPPIETLPPGEEPPDGAFPPPLAFVAFDRVADLLPEGFLAPEAVEEMLQDFGEDHPLIGDGGAVNPELEAAMHERPPVPDGFDAFDFEADQPQFDDMFTIYDDGRIGETQRGQVNATFDDVLDDGTRLRCSDTTVIETVQGEATPLVEMEPGVYQTQWVVNIRQLTTTVAQLEDPDDPLAVDEIEQAKEILSQMVWTMLMQEVDTDGDGEPDELRVSGSNVVDVLDEKTEGGPPDGYPPLPPSPPLMLPLDFEGILQLNQTPPQREARLTTPAR